MRRLAGAPAMGFTPLASVERTPDQLLSQYWDDQRRSFFEWVHALVQRSVAEHNLGPQPPLEVNPPGLPKVIPLPVPLALPIAIAPSNDLVADLKRQSQALLLLMVVVAAEGLGIAFLVMRALR
jgi:hypothetical protein